MELSDDVFGALMTPEARLDPYHRYAAYLADRPVIDSGFGLWFVFGYADCLQLLRDRRMSVDERNSALAGNVEDPEFPTLIHLDPPDHDRLRRLVQAAFTPRRVEGLRARAAELTEQAVARLRGRSEVDLIAEVAYPVPLTIICELLGVQSDEYETIREWSVWLARSIDPGVLRSAELNDRIGEAQAHFVGYVRGLIARRRRSPGDDLFSQLVGAELDGDRLSEPELIGLALLLLVAGHETTVNLVGNGMHALLRSPAQLAAARSCGDEGRRRMVDELLRFDSPVQMTSRIALDAVELRPGMTMAPGEVAVLLLGSANRDPEAFAGADRLDVGATRPTPHLAFGHGLHHCLGAALARAEGEVMIPAVLNAFPRLALAHEPRIRPSFVLRGRESLPVALG